MTSSSPRATAGLRHAFVALGCAFALLATTPRESAATALLCLPNGGCEVISGGCEPWNANSGVTCFLIGTLAKPRLERTGDGGAVVLLDGKKTRVASDVLAGVLDGWAARGKAGKLDAKSVEQFQADFAKAARTGAPKVSERRLTEIAGELKVRIEGGPRG